MPYSLPSQFTHFADAECRETSPLYHHLAHAIAADDILLEIAAHSLPGQPAPNLLLGAVHLLLASAPAHPLRAFYATFNNPPADPAHAFPAFRDFTLTHRAEIIALLQTRRVQTNEVSRCAYLLPALTYAANRFDPQPLALVEIGTSAGLNLFWDRYRYSYEGDPLTYGNAQSQVHITSRWTGPAPEILSQPPPKISHRLGLDLHPIDPTLPEEAAWLRALIWPEHQSRRALLDAALSQLDPTPLDLRAGDGFAQLPEIAAEIPQSSLLCVYHTHVANQISEQARDEFLRTLETLGQTRDLIHLCNNIHPTLHLTTWRHGHQLLDTPLAKSDGHARQLQWLAPP